MDGQKKATIIIKGIFFSYMTIGLILILLSYGLYDTPGDRYATQYGEKKITDVAVERPSKETRVFRMKIPPSDEYNNCLLFYSSHAAIKVSTGENVIYRGPDKPDRITGTVGTTWNLVLLPSGTTDITVESTSLFTTTNDFKMTFSYGNAHVMLLKKLRMGLQGALISLLSVTLGIAMVVYWLLFRTQSAEKKDSLYVGIFTICLGLWSLILSPLTELLMKRPAISSLMEYLLLLIMMPAFVLYIQDYMELPSNRVAVGVCAVMYTNMGVVLLLHLLDICRFRDTLVMTQMSSGFALGFYAYAVYKGYRLYGMTRRIRLNIICVLIAAVSIGIDVVMYYMVQGYPAVIAKIGLLLFVSALGYDTVQNSLRLIDEGRKAQLYKELAEVDMLTGLLNRNAYGQWEEKTSDYVGVGIATVDLNDLKLCNDQLGHAYGDKYIQDAAKIIRESFQPQNKCYRMGGDEFCVVVYGATVEQMKEALGKMSALEDEYNRVSPNIQMHLAKGFAVYDEKTDKKLSDVRERADIYMYEKKAAMKNEAF